MKLTDIKLPEGLRIEDVLCLGHLIGKLVLPYNATLGDAAAHYRTLDCCADCEYKNDCPAVIMND